MPEHQEHTKKKRKFLSVGNKKSSNLSLKTSIRLICEQTKSKKKYDISSRYFSHFIEWRKKKYNKKINFFSIILCLNWNDIQMDSLFLFFLFNFNAACDRCAMYYYVFIIFSLQEMRENDETKWQNEKKIDNKKTSKKENKNEKELRQTRRRSKK